MDSVERKLVKEVLNGDKDAIAEIIEAHPNRMNFISQCGECPMSIAVYKRDIHMVRLLLKAGANPNQANHQGDTVFHIAARIGSVSILKELYSSGLCNLVLVNKNNQLAVDLATQAPCGEDVNLLHLFGEWRSDSMCLDEELEELVLGRTQCVEFLRTMGVEDDTNHRQAGIDVLVNLNADEHRMRRVLRDSVGLNSRHDHLPVVIPRQPIATVADRESMDTRDGKEGDRISINGNYHHSLVYNAYKTPEIWTPGQISRYESNKSDQILVTRSVFVEDYVSKLITGELDKCV